jgi:hypothetical protein
LEVRLTADGNLRESGGGDAALSVPADSGDAVAAIPEGETDSASSPTTSVSQNGTEVNSTSDDVAESAFLAEARERGESVSPTPKSADRTEEVDPKSLPPLDELVRRIPADVREALDELFRAKFVTVRRLPKDALKQPTSAKR